MNIVLIGYRGTGKSVIGEVLSRRLNMELIKLDEQIARRAQLSIPDIVRKFGWDYFRDLEADVAREASERSNCIIDTGGGVILRKENVENLKKNGILFWLKAEAPTIYNRIKGSSDRPSLTGGKSFLEEIEQVLGERLPHYREAARHEIETDNNTPEEIAEKIIALFRRD